MLKNKIQDLDIKIYYGICDWCCISILLACSSYWMNCFLCWLLKIYSPSLLITVCCSTTWRRPRPSAHTIMYRMKTIFTLTIWHLHHWFLDQIQYPLKHYSTGQLDTYTQQYKGILFIHTTLFHHRYRQYNMHRSRCMIDCIVLVFVCDFLSTVCLGGLTRECLTLCPSVYLCYCLCVLSWLCVFVCLQECLFQRIYCGAK